MTKIVTLGELLLRLTTPQNQVISQSSAFDACYGGAEANVAVALSEWGHKVKYVTRLPKNDIASAAVSALKKHGVQTSDILYGGDRMGLYYLQSGVGGRAPEVTYDRAYSSMSTALPGMWNWKEILEGADIFHWTGITPSISDAAALVCNEAILAAVDLGITISVDLNFRGKLWKYGKLPTEVMPQLVQHCDLIFGGIDAPGHYFNIFPEGKSDTKGVLSEKDIVSVCTQVLERFPKAKYFSSTLREVVNANHHRLQGIAFDGKSLLSSTLYDIPYLVDRVGGGDAFMAGLLHMHSTHDIDPQAAIEFAAAASFFKHYLPGDFPLTPEGKILDLIKGNGTEIGR